MVQPSRPRFENMAMSEYVLLLHGGQLGYFFGCSNKDGGASIGGIAKFLCTGVVVRRTVFELSLDTIHYLLKECALNICLLGQ